MQVTCLAMKCGGWYSGSLRLGTIPEPGTRMRMRMISTREASELTGLSKGKLREWTSRRALIPADIPPKKQGSPAKFTWQTILLLRVAVMLRDQFHLELQAYRQVLMSLRCGLEGTSFIGLWGKTLVIRADQTWSLVDEPELDDALLIQLGPHLDAVSRGFALPRPTSSPSQLDLFPVRTVVSDERTGTAVGKQPEGAGVALAGYRRRFA